MSTPTHTHRKIQEISNNYISGKAPISISSIADEMGINRDTIEEHITILKRLDLVDYTDMTSQTIILTDSGKQATL